MNGNWWDFGNSIIYSTECDVSYIAEAKKDIDNMCWKKVHSETVGRFVNICDEECIPIFENDIVHAQFLIHTFNSWGNSIDEELSVVGVVNQIDTSFGILSAKGQFYFDSTDKELLSVRIIGNIFDSPETLKEDCVKSDRRMGVEPVKQSFRCRGKSSRYNKWLYGIYQEYPVGDEQESIIAVAERHIFSPVMAREFQVISSSVGRSIGHSDRNNTEIFEGDILKYEFFSEENAQLLICVWNKTECRFEFRIISGSNGSFLLPSDIKTHCIEIVGNWIDNPELIKD